MGDRPWQPSCDRHSLGARARLNAAIRRFFAARDVLEVETPCLSLAATTDPNIASFAVGGAPARYLHTSPEFPMKRLLAAGSGDVYQLCKVFRQGECGRYHNPEFTLLEWYRLGFDHHRLMGEVAELVQRLAAAFQRPVGPVVQLRYGEALARYAGLDLQRADATAVRICLAQNGVAAPEGLGDESLDPWLDLLMSTVVCAALPMQQLTFIYDYPASQAALSRITPEGAARFELYWGAVELANGFYELTDAEEQGVRFARDNVERARRGQPAMPLDRALLDALAAGLPDCAGVALGVDRLLMALTDAEHIEQVLSFSYPRA